MAVRTNPTGRQLRLGSGAAQAARASRADRRPRPPQLLGIRQAQVSNMETGRIGVSAERRTRPGLSVRVLGQRPGRGRRWAWSRTGNAAGGRSTARSCPAPLLDLAELEHHATVAAHRHHRAHPWPAPDHRPRPRDLPPGRTEFSRTEVEHRVSFRIKRQAVLLPGEPRPVPRDHPRSRAAHEVSAAHRSPGASLSTCSSMSEREHITLRVIPFDIGAYPGSGQSILYVHGPVPQLDTVHLDQSHGPALRRRRSPVAEVPRTPRPDGVRGAPTREVPRPHPQHHPRPVKGTRCS